MIVIVHIQIPFLLLIEIISPQYIVHAVLFHLAHTSL